MAYDPEVQRPQCIHATPTTRVWQYESDDAVADVTADDYFTDGAELGMKNGDGVIVTGANGGIAIANFADNLNASYPTNAENVLPTP